MIYQTKSIPYPNDNTNRNPYLNPNTNLSPNTSQNRKGSNRGWKRVRRYVGNVTT